MLQVIPHSVRCGNPVPERFRLMKGKDRTRSVFDIVEIRKARQGTSGLIGKTDLVAFIEILKGAICVPEGLTFNHGDILCFSIFLCFDDPHRLSCYKKGIVDRPGTRREFADCDSKSCREINFVHILNDPSGIN